MIQNTDYILKTPEGRAMATAKALGVDMSALFGSKKPALAATAAATETVVAGNTTSGEDTEGNPQGENAAQLAADAANDEPDFPDDPPNESQGEETEFERLTATLEEYMTFKEYLDITTKSGTNPYKLAEAELNSKTATEDSRSKMIDRIRNFLIQKKVPGVV
jgi:cobalamin biosynthesis protein CobT